MVIQMSPLLVAQVLLYYIIVRVQLGDNHFMSWRMAHDVGRVRCQPFLENGANDSKLYCDSGNAYSYLCFISVLILVLG